MLRTGTITARVLQYWYPISAQVCRSFVAKRTGGCIMWDGLISWFPLCGRANNRIVGGNDLAHMHEIYPLKGLGLQIDIWHLHSIFGFRSYWYCSMPAASLSLGLTWGKYSTLVPVQFLLLNKIVLPPVHTKCRPLSTKWATLFMDRRKYNLFCG